MKPVEPDLVRELTERNLRRVLLLLTRTLIRSPKTKLYNTSTIELRGKTPGERAQRIPITSYRDQKSATEACKAPSPTLAAFTEPRLVFRDSHQRGIQAEGVGGADIAAVAEQEKTLLAPPMAVHARSAL